MVGEYVVKVLGEALTAGTLMMPAATPDTSAMPTPAELAALRAAITDLSDALKATAATPLIDAVQVAAAIAGHPDILAAIAGGVARQLASITGSITLSGGLSATISPPPVG
jgi:hypothetical protein